MTDKDASGRNFAKGRLRMKVIILGAKKMSLNCLLGTAKSVHLDIVLLG